MTVMSELPPLNPLHVFTVVARSKNLAAAAAELNVTQSAVSRQITALEQHFGCKLFRRTRYGLDLLPNAEGLVQQASEAFAQLAASAQKFRASLDAAEQVITIKTYTSFAASWLIPRLPEFCARHPQLKIVIKTGAKAIDFSRQEGDLSIQILKRSTAPENATLLYQEVIEPVCSPEFLQRYAPNAKYPSSLLRQTVIASEFRDSDWQLWLEHSGFSADYQPSKVMNVGNALLGWDAAAGGIGIAMGQTKMLTDKIQQGRLLTPFNFPVHTDKYYFVFLPKTEVKPGALMFRDWMLTQF